VSSLCEYGVSAGSVPTLLIGWMWFTGDGVCYLYLSLSVCVCVCVYSNLIWHVYIQIRLLSDLRIIIPTPIVSSFKYLSGKYKTP